MADNDVTPADKRTISASLVVALLVGAGIAAFIFQNTDDVKVHWLMFDRKAPLWLVEFVTVAASVVGAELAAMAIRRSRKK